MLTYGRNGPPQTESILASKTHEILLEKLVEYRNDLYSKQILSLADLCVGYQLMAMGHLNGWHAFPMLVGGGKTLSIRALCQALSELPELHRKGQADSSYEDVSILVCALKVEALCKLKRELVEDGVPEEWIGRYHSYQCKKEMAQRFLKGDHTALKENYASEPATRTRDNDNRRILLTTHQRVSGKSDYKHYGLYKGNPRSIVIYDESLIKAKPVAVAFDWVKAGVALYEERASDGNLSEKALEAFEYLKQAYEMVKLEINAQEDEKREPELIALPRLSKQDIDVYKKALGNEVESLHELLNISQKRLRVLLTMQGEHQIHYGTTRPLICDHDNKCLWAFDE